MNNTSMQPIWLASQSPRRAELLAGMGVPFEVLRFTDAHGAAYEVDESVHFGETPRAYVQRVALAKAHHAAEYLRRHDLAPRPLLAADTTVALDDRILGKPQDAADARAMLHALSGQRHEVLTALVLIDGIDGTTTRLALSVSQVQFIPLSATTIERYIASGKPFDKAGAYGIQGHAGLFVSEIHGSFSGIMGLPVHETALLLETVGFVI